MPVRSIVFVACVAACAVAHLAILLSVARRPVRAADPVGSAVPQPRRGVEILWALLPAIVLALVFTATWDRVRDGSDAEPHVHMKVAG